MKITTLASGSSGNCYLLEDSGSMLFLEAGISLKRVQESIGFRATEAAGCLVSHNHGDHAKYVKDFAKAGIDCYMSAGTAEAITVTGHRIHNIKSEQQFAVDEWRVVPCDAVHDAAEPLCFLIGHSDSKILFATDTSYIKYQFRGLTHIMIEANFDREILTENIDSGQVERGRKTRLIESHMSIDRVVDFLTQVDRSKLREIHLLHLSNDNSNAAEFKRQIQRLTGVPVYVA